MYRINKNILHSFKGDFKILVKSDTADPRYNDSVCYQRFCCKIEFAVVKKLDRTYLKHQ